MTHPTPAQIKRHICRRFAEDAETRGDMPMPSRALRIALEAVSDAVRDAEKESIRHEH